MTDSGIAITARGLAAEVETSYHRLSKWLRQQRDAGHPVLADFPARRPLRFTRSQADQLAAEFAAAEADGHVSDSAVQRRAEEVITDMGSSRRDCRHPRRPARRDPGRPNRADDGQSSLGAADEL